MNENTIELIPKMSPAEKLAKQKGSAGPKTPTIIARKPKWRCKLKEKRKVLNLTLRDIGRASGMTFTTIYNIERGFEISLSHALKICQFFECTVEEMWPETIDGGKWPEMISGGQMPKLLPEPTQ